MYAAPMAIDVKKIDEAIRVEAGKQSNLDKRDHKADDLLPDRDEAEAHLAKCAKSIDTLQDRLYAEGQRALLVVLQGIDTAGKDGTVRGVFNQCGPLGVRVTAFGRPTDIELAHDYLWRVHAATPRKGHIGVFNRSHYEDVLVVKVRDLAPKKAVEQRYDQINAFEKHLVENGTTILKFMLNISKDEQQERLQARLDDKAKHWKFNPSDLEDRKLWDAFQDAYETMLDRCSTEHAQWRVVPADRKWQRNTIIASIVNETLERMDPKYPKVDWDPKECEIT